KTRIAETAARIAARVQASEADGLVFGAESLRRRLQLDDEDLDVLLHAAAAPLDPQLARLHTRLSGQAFHPWFDVGIAVQLHHATVGAQLRGRARFQPNAPLQRHRLILLDRSRPDARDNLLQCEIKLPPRVARVLLGTDPSGGAATFARLIAPDVELEQVMLP